MGNKMRGGKKCDFTININVAATTARRARSRDGGGGFGAREVMLND